MESKKIIGFAGTYYTLWNYSKDIHYHEINGVHYKSYEIEKYTYERNISTDLDKTKLKFPNVEIDPSLKGSSSFSIINEDRTNSNPEIFKFGKYCGKDIRDVVKSDFDYVLFLINKIENHPTIEVAKQTKEYLEYVDGLKRSVEEKINSFKPIESGSYKFTLCNNPDSYGDVWFNVSQDHSILLMFENVRSCYYNGFEYYLPVLKNGKAKRIKNKEIEYEIIIEETKLDEINGILTQKARVVNWN